jgi:hypothetical protein
MPSMTAGETGWVIFILAVAYVARIFILKACCAVTDVKEPGYLMAALWALVVLAVMLGSAWLFGWLFGKLDADPDVRLGTMRVTGVLFSLVVSLGLAGLLYWLVLATTPFKGFWVAAIELLLNLLVASLLLCIFFVSMAVEQLTGLNMVWQIVIGGPFLLLIIAGLVYWYVIRPKMQDRAAARGPALVDVGA